MVDRSIKLPKSQSFFLFGARGTGKSTLLKSTPHLKDALRLDLLRPSQEEAYALRPELLREQCRALERGRWVIVDEVQKVPKLLDVVHEAIEEKKIKFALTGSSSRKLKRGHANLLAGRAIVLELHPLTTGELGDKFDLKESLRWGSLPKLLELPTAEEKARYLRSYCLTYVKEEVVAEQLIRNLDPFRHFLPIAAQMDTQIINYSNISRDTGSDHKTIQNYFQILVDTHLGFFLEPFHRSVRKVQRQSPKFYFFDGGVKRALERRLTIPPEPSTSDFGNAFESWFINECVRLNSYRELDLKFSYLRTKDDVEIDLIVEKPDGRLILIEIKSSDKIDSRHIRSLLQFKKDFRNAQLICACRVPKPQFIDGIEVLPWTQALARLED
ncbi:MAG: AAA family ATPase [Bdellovibrionota bacterium]